MLSGTSPAQLQSKEEVTEFSSPIPKAIAAEAATAVMDPAGLGLLSSTDS